MPTVLTERLKKKNFKLGDWIVEDVIRVFGLAACLRDEDRDLNKKQILKALEEYDKKKEQELKQTLNPKYPPMLSEKELKKQYNKLIKENEKDLKSQIELQTKIDNSIKEFKQIKSKIEKKDMTEIVVNLIEEIEKQLNVAQKEVKDNIRWCKDTTRRYSTFEKYKKYREEDRKQEIKHIEEDKEEAQNEVLYEYAREYKRLLTLFCK